MKVRARKWDENAIRKLKERRIALQEELQQLHRTAKRELNVEMKRNQIRQTEQRIKFTQQEIKKIEDSIRRMEQDYEIESSELDTIEVKNSL